VCHATVIIWTQLGPVADNERASSWKIPDARLHTTETETETRTIMTAERGSNDRGSEMQHDNQYRQSEYSTGKVRQTQQSPWMQDE